MQRSRRMETIVWLAAQAERDAAERLLSSRRELDDLTHKLRQLHAGRDEYTARLASGTAMSALQMRELRHFIDKLNAAIGQLERQIQHKQQVNAEQQDAWVGRKRRTEALGDIAGRYRREEARTAESRAQRELDDRRVRRDTEL